MCNYVFLRIRKARFLNNAETKAYECYVKSVVNLGFKKFDTHTYYKPYFSEELDDDIYEVAACCPVDIIVIPSRYYNNHTTIYPEV